MNTLQKNKQELLKKLGQLGMSHDDIRIYIVLLDGGRKSLQAILAETRIPPKVVSNTLKRLEALYLITATADAGRLRYSAADPCNTWAALIYDDSWRETKQIITTFEDACNHPTPRRKLLIDIHELILTIYSEFECRHYGKVFDNSDMFALVCCYAIRTASHQLLALACHPPLPQIALFWPAIINVRQRCVPYKRYTTLKEVLLHGVDIVSRDVEKLGINMNLHFMEQKTDSVFLIDQKKIFIFQHNETDNKFLARVSNNPHLVRRFVKNRIQPVIESAISFPELRDSIFELIRQRRNEIGRSDVHLQAFDQVASMGKFACMDEQVSKAAIDLMSEGIFERVGQNFMLTDILTPTISKISSPTNI